MIIKLKILILLLGILKSQSYVNNVQEFCKDIKYDLTIHEFLEKKAENSTNAESSSGFNMITTSTKSIASFFEKQSEIELLSGAIIILIVPLIIGLLAVATFVFSILFFFILKQAEDKTKKKLKIQWFSKLAVSFIFLSFFVVFLYTSASMNGSIDTINCSVSQIPNKLFLGSKIENYQYMGITNLIQFFEYFHQEASSFVEVSTFFANIKNLSLNQIVIEGENNIQSFNTTFKEKQIKDGEGNENTPQIITDLPKTIDKVSLEYNKYANVANITNSASEQGRQVSTQASVDTLKEEINKAKEKMSKLLAQTETMFDNITLGIKNYTERQNLFYIFSLILGIVAMVIIISFLLITCYQCNKNSCFKLYTPLKILLVISTVISIYFSLAALIAVVQAAAIGSACSDIQGLLTQESLDSIITGSGFAPDPETLSYLNNCIPEKQTGDIKEYIGASFEQAQTILNGMTQLENFTYNITTALNDMKSVQETVLHWDYFKNGYYSNFENVPSTIQLLNDQLRCDNQEIQLNKLNCTESSNKICAQIDQVPTPYSPPNCVPSTEDTHKYFSNIREYFQRNQQFMTDIMNALSSEESTTPNQNYKNLIAKLKEALNSHQSIKAYFSSTLNKASSFYLGFSDFSNCKILRKVLLNFDQNVCQTSNTSSFFYFVSLELMTVCLISINILLFFIMRNIDDGLGYNKFDDSFEEQETQQVKS